MTILTQTRVAKAAFDGGDQTASDSMVETLPMIESFRKIAHLLSDEESLYVGQNISYWNCLRRAEPDKVPDTSGLDALSKFVACREFLYIYWKRYLCLTEARNCRERITELLENGPAAKAAGAASGK